jgi:hypothetical protein
MRTVLALVLAIGAVALFPHDRTLAMVAALAACAAAWWPE